jgi:hypothetical protein
MHLWKKFRVLSTALASSLVALKKRRLSSANRRCEIPSAFLATFIGVILPAMFSFFRMQVKASPTRRNK